MSQGPRPGLWELFESARRWVRISGRVEVQKAIRNVIAVGIEADLRMHKHRRIQRIGNAQLNIRSEEWQKTRLSRFALRCLHLRSNDRFESSPQDTVRAQTSY